MAYFITIYSRPHSILRLEHLEAELRDTRKRLQFTNVRKIFSKELHSAEKDMEMIKTTTPELLLRAETEPANMGATAMMETQMNMATW